MLRGRDQGLPEDIDCISVFQVVSTVSEIQSAYW